MRAGYHVLRAEEIPRLNGTLYDLVHERTGARHVHLAVPDRNSYFCALYRTPPDDSTGAPHVMEHCVSGGSRRFPPGAGGDMYNRSLLTDVNGMTSADYTTFYIASRNHTDYMNWLEYIVDVTLYPRMDLDHFLRQGGHFEFNTPDDPSSGLRFTGTVYNEMKATFASPQTHAVRALGKALFPGHPYSRSSGGDPFEMRTLTYEYIRAFKDRFYHPGNGIYISRGDVPLDQILEATEEIIGDNFDRAAPSATPEVAAIRGPVVAEAPLPAGEPQLWLGWVTAPVTDSLDRLRMEVATEAVFGRVERALHDSGLVHGPVSAFPIAYRRLTIALSIAGIDARDADRIESLVLDTIANDSLDVDAAVARLELRRRDPSNGIAAFLQMVIPPLVHGGDPFPALELDSDLAQLGDLHDLVRAQLVENTHRARVTLEPDAGLEGRVRDEENAWLAVVAPTLDAQEIVEQAQRLAAPTSHDYPKRGLTPLEALTTLHAPEPASVAGGIAHFDLPTDGITYLTVRIDLSDLDDELVPLLGPLSGLMAKRATEGTRADAIRVVNHARVDARGDATAHWLEISARALTRDGHELLSMLRRALDLADLSALPDVAAERAGAIEQGLFGSAQAHLRRLASASLRRCGRIEDSTRGLGQLRFLKAKEFARVVELRAAVLDRSRYAGCVVGERLAGLGDVLTIEAASPSRPITDVLRGPRPHVARVAQLPNAFTCAAYSIPGLENEDGPAIAVLAQVLFAGFLNAEVRRGGAYGVDFQALPERGVLWISTRRDPLPDASYHAIDDGIARFATKTWDAMPAADGLIGILRVTDPVDTPATAARRAWLGTFTGHTAEAWNAYRRRVLDVTDDDLARVAADYLTEPSRATLVGPSMKDGPYDEIGDV